MKALEIKILNETNSKNVTKSIWAVLLFFRVMMIARNDILEKNMTTLTMASIIFLTKTKGIIMVFIC